VTDLVRSARRPKLSEATAYYAMGILALGIAGFVLSYHGIRNWKASHFQVEKGDHRTPAQESPTLSTPTPIQTPPAEIHQHSQLDENFISIASMNIGEKIDYWSNYLERNRAGRDILATFGSKFPNEDTDPLFPSKYNCTTYVETVAALARSQSIDDVVSRLLAIRYKDGKAGFFNRNHFPEADWIPNNQQSLILEDITSKIAQASGVTVNVEQKKIDKAQWYSSHHAGRVLKSHDLASALPPDWIEPKTVNLDYISIADLEKSLDKIPTGTVVNFVHQGDQLHPVLITHQGFVIRANGGVYIRHASTGGSIRTNNLVLYIQSLLKQHQSNSRWPLIGVNFNQINSSTSANNLRKEVM
jgi:hypothetical protein